jgi:hypothetical protein
LIGSARRGGRGGAGGVSSFIRSAGGGARAALRLARAPGWAGAITMIIVREVRITVSGWPGLNHNFVWAALSPPLGPAGGP